MQVNMERKQGFFSALKQEVVRGLSPGRSRGRRSQSPSPSASGLRQRKKSSNNVPPPPEVFISRSGNLRPGGVDTLSPLREGPDPELSETVVDSNKSDKWGSWLCRNPSAGSASFPDSQRPDLRLLLGVLGAPLAPVHVSSNDSVPYLCIKDIPIETSSAQYILQQYTAACGGQKRQSTIQNAYAMGKVRMLAYDMETATKVMKGRHSRTAESGGFVLWQMNPDKWYVELALGTSKVHAGCNGDIVWRHTPWLGAHTAKGPVRPLRRALQGLDPGTTANMFSGARCTGEKKINGEDCFVLKLCADAQTLKARSEGPAEVIRHVLFGYFSQKTGLLVHLEDSHLTRIQPNGGDAVYWETTISSFLDDYRAVDGIMIAHSGRSVVTLFRFGDTAVSHSKTRMEEAWSVEEVAFNVPGLSVDCFIPPAELLRYNGSIGEDHPREGGRVRTTKACAAAAAPRASSVCNRARAATWEKQRDVNVSNIVLRKKGVPRNGLKHL